MLTKTAFLAILNDENNRIGATVHIAEFGENELIIKQDFAPNAGLSVHRSAATKAAAFVKYNAWLNEWCEARAAESQARIDALDADRAHNQTTTTPTTTTEDTTVNKAKAKQQQTPATLPKPQMIDVLRAVLRMQGEATDAQISAVAAMTETAMRKTITAIINKGARVTAHLVKSKRYGYGALTFGIEGQLPPGAYHALPVKNMKDARNVASQYGALMWNF